MKSCLDHNIAVHHIPSISDGEIKMPTYSSITIFRYESLNSDHRSALSL